MIRHDSAKHSIIGTGLLAGAILLLVGLLAPWRATAHPVAITDPTLVVTPAPLAQPIVNAVVLDPVFATTLRRVSDVSSRGGFETPIYAQLQAFSADNTYLLTVGRDGYQIRRVQDLAPLRGLDTGAWNAPRWHPQQASVIVHYDSNADTTLRVQFTDVETQQVETIFVFPQPYQRIRSNPSFEELSRDGRWLAGLASLADGRQMVFALDLVERALGAQFTVDDLYAGPCTPDPEWGNVEPDWIGVSPLGRYLVMQWPRDGVAHCSGLESFDLVTGAFVGRAYDGHQHGDLGVLPDGETEFIMTFELYNPDANGGLSIGYRTLPGAATVSAPVYLQVMDWNGAHISCQGPAGVCLVTTDATPGNGWSALEGELFLQYTDGRVERLVHHRSSACGYWVQPRATLSRDSRYVAFASDWGVPTGCEGGGMGQGDAYIVDRGAAPAVGDARLYLPLVNRTTDNSEPALPHRSQRPQ